MDDTVITRLGPETFYLVTNAACKAKDLAYITEQLSTFDTTTHGRIDWQVRAGWGLVALQGPLSADVLADALRHTVQADSPHSSTPSTPETSAAFIPTLLFGQSIEIHIQPDPANPTLSGPILISRAGYTGEDGFEIAVPPHLTDKFTRHLLSIGTPSRLRLAGLGARDSLRLEAGMCLYGHDLDDTTTPVEAGLSWVVAKDRRTPASPETSGFHGAESILRQLRPAKEGGGVTRRRVGLIVDGTPAREGAEIFPANPNSNPESGGKETIGKVTSGCPSPTLGKNIAMGYIATGFHKAGTEVEVHVRGKRRKGTVTKMPFVQSRYWKGDVGGTGTAPA